MRWARDRLVTASRLGLYIFTGVAFEVAILLVLSCARCWQVEAQSQCLEALVAPVDQHRPESEDNSSTRIHQGRRLGVPRIYPPTRINEDEDLCISLCTITTFTIIPENSFTA